MPRKRYIYSILSFIFAFILAFCTLLSGCAKNDYSLSWAINNIKRHYLYDLTEEQIHYAVYNGGINSLLDIYSGYYSAEEYRAMLATNQGSYSGLGINLSYKPNQGILIEKIIDNSPAYYAELPEGEILVSAQTGDQSAHTFTGLQDFSLYVAQVQTGEDIHFTSQEGTVYTIAKAAYTASYAHMYMQNTSYTFQSDQTKELQLTIKNGSPYTLPNGMAYLRLHQFMGDCSKQVGILIEQFNANNGTSLVIDLRGNGGGYVSDMQKIGGMLTANYDTPSFAMKAIYKDGKEEVSPIILPTQTSQRLKADVKVYVLADINTASASEALIGVLYSANMIDYSDIYLADYSSEYLSYVGTTKNARSYGKGIMQAVYLNYQTGEAIKLTTAKIYWPNGTCIHDTGVTVGMGCKSINVAWSTIKGDPFMGSFLADVA